MSMSRQGVGEADAPPPTLSPAPPLHPPHAMQNEGHGSRDAGPPPHRSSSSSLSSTNVDLLQDISTMLQPLQLMVADLSQRMQDIEEKDRNTANRSSEDRNDRARAAIGEPSSSRSPPSAEAPRAGSGPGGEPAPAPVDHRAATEKESGEHRQAPKKVILNIGADDDPSGDDDSDDEDSDDDGGTAGAGGARPPKRTPSTSTGRHQAVHYSAIVDRLDLKAIPYARRLAEFNPTPDKSRLTAHAERLEQDRKNAKNVNQQLKRALPSVFVAEPYLPRAARPTDRVKAADGRPSEFLVAKERTEEVKSTLAPLFRLIEQIAMLFDNTLAFAVRSQQAGGWTTTMSPTDLAILAAAGRNAAYRALLIADHRMATLRIEKRAADDKHRELLLAGMTRTVTAYRDENMDQFLEELQEEAVDRAADLFLFSGAKASSTQPNTPTQSAQPNLLARRKRGGKKPKGGSNAGNGAGGRGRAQSDANTSTNNNSNSPSATAGETVVAERGGSATSGANTSANRPASRGRSRSPSVARSSGNGAGSAGSVRH